MLVWMGKMMSKRIKYTDAVPNSIVTRYKEDNTQYLLDQVARLTAENAMLKEKWLAQPEQIEQEPVAWMYEWVNEIGEHVKSVVYNFYDDANLIPLYTAPPNSTRAEQLAFEEGIIFAKNLYNIGGEPLSNEQKRLEATLEKLLAGKQNPSEK